MKRSLVPVMLMLSLAIALLVGCTGKDGPAGKDAVGVDAQSPHLSITYPTAGDTLTDTLLVRVDAIDNVGIARIAFFLDGSDVLHDTVMTWVEEPPYQYEYMLPEIGIRSGAHTLAARAYDLAGNTETTPSMVLYYLPADTGTVYMRNFDPRTTDLGQHAMVHHTVQGDTLTITTVDSFAVRFEPSASCFLTGIRVYTDSIPSDTNYIGNENWGSGLVCRVAYSDGAYPLGIAANGPFTALQPDTSADYYGWQSASFGGSSVDLDTVTVFHIVFAVYNSNENTYMAIRTEEKEAYDGLPYLLPLHNYTHVYNREEGQWEPYQTYYGTGSYEFWVEAIVDYGDGQTAVLSSHVGSQKNVRE